MTLALIHVLLTSIRYEDLSSRLNIQLMAKAARSQDIESIVEGC